MYRYHSPYAGAGIILWGGMLIMVKLLELLVPGYTRKLLWSQRMVGVLFFVALGLMAIDFVPLILKSGW